MTKAERKRELLGFLMEYNLALPPAAIHRNLKLHRRLHISASTVENYLDELVDEGKVIRIDPEPLQEQNIVEVGPDEDIRAYYLITTEGKQAVEDDSFHSPTD